MGKRTSRPSDEWSNQPTDDRRSDPPKPRDPAKAGEGPGEVRIIGGRLRGSIIPFDGDPRVRPMKDRVREAVFNLLGKQIVGAHVVDLFAGTGALAIEALSRGAARATLIERHFPTAKQCEWALRRFELDSVARVLAGDAFFWGQRWLHPDSVREGLPDGSLPWLVFCCPPYQLFYERRKELKAMIASIAARAPAGSRIVVESDERFDMAELCRADEWQVREYPPAIIAILRIDASPPGPADSGEPRVTAEPGVAEPPSQPS